MSEIGLENGYTRIANEILEQIFRSKLNGTQFKILLVLWRYTYGFSRKECELSEAFIAKATDTHKIQLSRELNKLISQNIVCVNREATFNKPRILSFNKHYSEWKGLQVVNSLTPNELDKSTVSEITNPTVSGFTNKDNKTSKATSKKDNEPDYQQIVDLFNKTCISFSKVTKVSEARKKAIRTRLKDNTEDDFKRLFEIAESSDFLKGKNDRGWSATFDWLIKDNNMIKVLEGNYSRKGKGETDARTYGETYGTGGADSISYYDQFLK